MNNDELIRRTTFDAQKELSEPLHKNWLHHTFDCPGCGAKTLNGDCPAYAPDYVCMECHLEWMEEHDDWKEDTLKRIALGVCFCHALPEDHPDWMKGMCECCYARWSNAWGKKE
jgi:hypothetical protein